ncbi:hypothetical protein CSO01_27720 [Cellulomonas soli]|uniref:Cobalt transporter n=2 Tax=Cellulomonas soli TaxID=931535 RepID=A0A512PFT2_9CELL|nr:hypothetical protein [Cellulomonas soli]NYI59800.1 hypothetical protein [Cellulomonas soli]GEP70057.1 hypothetical protein CSO01_27720 [Cellulomonas soli]
MGTLAVAALAVAGVVVVLDRTAAEEPVVARCVATVDGSAWALEPEQADNAAMIAAVGLRRGLPARAVTIALATALQESKLINIDYGDRDSLGLFQQRPSQGWGTAEQIMDPVYATGKFYDGLVAVAGYEQMEITDAAQAVQRSGYPEAYAGHESRARTFASALTGWSPAALTCTFGEAGAPVGTDTVVARLVRDLGDLPTDATAATADAPASLVVHVDPLGAEQDRLAWAVGHWAVSLAGPLGLDTVTVGDQVWVRDATTWTTTEEPAAAGTVRITLAG